VDAAMPMVKSAVRDGRRAGGYEERRAGNLPIDSFVVSAAEARWTTGFTGRRATTLVERLVRIRSRRHERAPSSMDHHHHAYGFWAPSVGDYVRHKILRDERQRRVRGTAQAEDPYSYIDRFDHAGIHRQRGGG